MNQKTKTRIRLAVQDYFKNFPEDWELVKPEIEKMRQNKHTDFGELKGTHNLKRALFTLPEKLSAMIGLKLTSEERQLFTQKENARWFASEYKVFRITNEI